MLCRLPFGPGHRPEADEVFREIAHARALQTFPLGDFAKGRGHRAAFHIISPQLLLQSFRRRVVVRGTLRNYLNFLPPELSFLGVPLQIVVCYLFAAVKAHAAQAASTLMNNNCKSALSITLHFHPALS